jgi:hypothetical protein
MLSENLLETLENSLRQTRNAENRLIESRRMIEAKIVELLEEDRNLGIEINALKNSAEQTEAAIISLLEALNKKEL